MSLGFRYMDNNGQNKVLYLNSTLYGLKKTPRYFWNYIVQKINKYGCTQTWIYPCLFFSEKMVAAYYVGIIIFWSMKDQ